MNITSVAAFGLLFGVVAFNSWGIFRPGTVPVQAEAPAFVHSTRVLSPGKEVREGGILQYGVVIEWRKPCAAKYDLIFWAEDGDYKVADLDRDGGKAEVTGKPVELRLSIELPRSVKIGDWTYQIIGRCQLPGEPWVWPIPHPPMKFTVIPREDDPKS